MLFSGRDTHARLKALDRSQAVVEFKSDGTIVSANRNFLALFGYELADIRGRHHSLLVDPRERTSHAYQAFWRSLANGEIQAAEFRRIGKDGREIWLQATYNPIFDPAGRPLKVVKFATDITMDVARRKQIELLSLVADGTDNSVVITDADGLIEYVNPGFTRLTGYGMDDVLGTKPGAMLQGLYGEAGGSGHGQTQAGVPLAARRHRPHTDNFAIAVGNVA